LAPAKRNRACADPAVTVAGRRRPVKRLQTALIVLLGTTLTAGALAALFVAHRATAENAAARAELERLQEENQAQQFHIQRFADQVNRMGQQLAKLQNYYARLRVLTRLNLEERTDPATDTGGPRSRESDADAYLDENLKRHISRIHWELEELQMEAEIQELNAHRVENFFDSQRSLLAATPTIWPVRGWITSRFGHRRSPFTGALQMHVGLDIAARPGAPVKAAADGTVIFSGWRGDYGLMVTLDHGYGYRTRYGHLDSVNVLCGQGVKRGEVIGSVGDTGQSTGPHLHYEVRLNNVPTDPSPYLLN